MIQGCRSQVSPLTHTATLGLNYLNKGYYSVQVDLPAKLQRTLFQWKSFRAQ